MNHEVASETAAPQKMESTISSPLEGNTIPLTETNDQAFASLALGKGIAIKPTSTTVYAPFSGKVTAVFPGNHAIGLTSDQGVELLIHIGIDTVNLQGAAFERLINEGDILVKGQELLHFDSEKINAAGYEDTVMITVTNTSNYLDVLAINKSTTIRVGEDLLAVF